MRFADYFGRSFVKVSGSQFPWMKMLKESSVAKMVDVSVSLRIHQICFIKTAFGLKSCVATVLTVIDIQCCCIFFGRKSVIFGKCG